MADVSGFTDEAMECLRLADAETNPNIRALLMEMAAGWQMFARQLAAAGASEPVRAEDLL